MDIPDDFKKLFALEGIEERLELLESLVTPAKKGELITLSSLADEELAAFFTRYIAHPNHANDADGKLRKRATFDDKIQALGRVLPKLDADPKNYQSHLDFLSAVRILRNTAAHNSGLHMDDAMEFSKNPEMLSMVADFPKKLWERVTALRDYLTALPL